MINQFLQELSNESDLVGDDGQMVEIVSADEIALANQVEGPAVNMVQHASQARDIADDLEDIAERADELADQDATYAEASVESAAREFSTIMKAHGLNYSCSSFESEMVTGKRAEGLARDARRAASDLRLKADAIDDISNEGILAKLFKSKDEKAADAVENIKLHLAKIKKHRKELNDSGVLIRNKTVGVFMIKDGKEITDFKVEFGEDVNKLTKLYEAVSRDLTLTEVDINNPYPEVAKLIPTDLLNQTELILKKGVLTRNIKRTADRQKHHRNAGIAWAVGLGLLVGSAVVGAIPAAAAAVNAASIAASVTSISESNKRDSTKVMSILATDGFDSISKDAERLFKVIHDNSWETALEQLSKSENKDARKVASNIKSAIALIKDISVSHLINSAKLFELTAKQLEAK